MVIQYGFMTPQPVMTTFKLVPDAKAMDPGWAKLIQRWIGFPQ
jgi:hypothetical protein